jgi:hypothetical protein
MASLSSLRSETTSSSSSSCPLRRSMFMLRACAHSVSLATTLIAVPGLSENGRFLSAACFTLQSSRTCVQAVLLLEALSGGNQQVLRPERTLREERDQHLQPSVELREGAWSRRQAEGAPLCHRPPPPPPSSAALPRVCQSTHVERCPHLCSLLQRSGYQVPGYPLQVPMPCCARGWGRPRLLWLWLPCGALRREG